MNSRSSRAESRAGSVQPERRPQAVVEGAYPTSPAFDYGLRPTLRLNGSACGAVLLLVALLPASASAAELDPKESQRAQVETLRAEVAGQLQLQAYDLLDELVFAWLKDPPFALQTSLVLADVSVPVG